MTEWSFAAVLDTIAEAVPERVMTRCGPRVTTFGASARTSTRLANFLSSRGLGAHTPHQDTARWECGQDRVALLMRNDRYPEAFIAATKARAVPVNVNYNYTAAEVADLLAYVRPRAVFYHRSFGPVVAQSITPAITDLLISVDDGSDTPLLPGAIGYDAAIAMGDPRPTATSPDDLVMICTGGTTGRPKGVLWRQGDMYVSSMGGADHPSASVITDIARAGGQTWFAVSPLMHALGLWSAFAAILAGHSVVLHDDRQPFDPRVVWNTAERHRVSMMSIVGDAYAAPLAAELHRADYDLSTLVALATGGAATHPQHKQALTARLPQLSIIDGYGSSETGGLGYGQSHHGQQSHTFSAWNGGVVLSDDRRRVLSPGDTEIGWAAKTGRIPLGYFDDPEATEATFPVIDGRRVSIPGIGPPSNPTAPSTCWAATPWSSTPAGRKSSSKRSSRSCAPTPRSPTPWSSVAPIRAGARRSPPWSAPPPGTTPTATSCASTAAPSWPASRHPRRSCSSTPCAAWAPASPTTGGPNGSPPTPQPSTPRPPMRRWYEPQRDRLPGQRPLR